MMSSVTQTLEYTNAAVLVCDEVSEECVASMSLAIVRMKSVAEMRKYRCQEQTDDRYALELFRRAMLRKDDQAWEVLQEQFDEMVRLWFRRHPSKEVALRFWQEEDYVDDAFRRLWQAAQRQAFAFTTLASALNYLHLCLNSAIMDALRDYCRPKEVSMPDAQLDLLVEDEYHQSELWEIIRELLTSEKERRLAYLHFCCNLKAREIMQHCPGEFSSESEIYRLKRNIVCRIMRASDKIRWKFGGS